MKRLFMRLYIEGHTSKADRAISNLHRVMEGLNGKFDMIKLVVVDVLERPQSAAEHKIYRTPILIREFPEPVHRITGDFSNDRKLFAKLGLVP